MFLACQVVRQKPISIGNSYRYIKRMYSISKLNKLYNSQLKLYKFPKAVSILGRHSLSSQHTWFRSFSQTKFNQESINMIQRRDGLLGEVYKQFKIVQSKKYQMSKEIQDQVINVLKTQLITAYK